MADSFSVGVNQRVNTCHVEEFLASGEGAGEVLVQAVRNLRVGYYGQEYVDSIFQEANRTYDIYDAEPFIQIHSGICLGTILLARIWVGSEPSADVEVAENSRKLSRVTESRPFEASFKGGKGEQDGVLAWSSPIKMERMSDGQTLLVKEHSAPLEVGYTHAWTSYVHLARYLCLARWCYGSKWITLFVNVNLVESTLRGTGSTSGGTSNRSATGEIGIY